MKESSLGAARVTHSSTAPTPNPAISLAVKFSIASLPKSAGYTSYKEIRGSQSQAQSNAQHQHTTKKGRTGMNTMQQQPSSDGPNIGPALNSSITRKYYCSESTERKNWSLTSKFFFFLPIIIIFQFSFLYYFTVCCYFYFFSYSTEFKVYARFVNITSICRLSGMIYIYIYRKRE